MVEKKITFVVVDKTTKQPVAYSYKKSMNDVTEQIIKELGQPIFYDIYIYKEPICLTN